MLASRKLIAVPAATASKADCNQHWHYSMRQSRGLNRVVIAAAVNPTSETVVQSPHFCDHFAKLWNAMSRSLSYPAVEAEIKELSLTIMRKSCQGHAR